MKYYKCEVYIPDLSECPSCGWKPGGCVDGRVWCCCGTFTESEWKKRTGPKMKLKTLLWAVTGWGFVATGVVVWFVLHLVNKCQ